MIFTISRRKEVDVAEDIPSTHPINFDEACEKSFRRDFDL